MGVYENPRVALQVVDDSVNAKCDTLGGLVGFRGRAVLTGPGRGRAGRGRAGRGLAGKTRPGMATPLAGSRRDLVAAWWLQAMEQVVALQAMAWTMSPGFK